LKNWNKNKNGEYILGWILDSFERENEKNGLEG